MRAGALLQSVDFMSVRDKSATAIEPLRSYVFADDGQLNQFNAFARMTKNRFDEMFGDAGTTRDGANVHAPQQALVSLLCSGLPAIAGDAEKIGFAECPEYIRLRQSLLKLRQRLRALLLESAAESLRGLLKRFQPDLSVQTSVGWHQVADFDFGTICHFVSWPYELGPNPMNRLRP